MNKDHVDAARGVWTVAYEARKRQQLDVIAKTDVFYEEKLKEMRGERNIAAAQADVVKSAHAILQECIRNEMDSHNAYLNALGIV
jgi:hypothetical protein